MHLPHVFFFFLNKWSFRVALVRNALVRTGKFCGNFEKLHFLYHFSTLSVEQYIGRALVRMRALDRGRFTFWSWPSVWRPGGTNLSCAAMFTQTCSLAQSHSLRFIHSVHLNQLMHHIQYHKRGSSCTFMGRSGRREGPDSAHRLLVGFVLSVARCLDDET